MTDRTDEFRGAVKVFRPTLVNAATGGSNGISQEHHSLLDPSPAPRPETSEFFQVASSVAVGFEGTSKLIERLKKLVGRKGFSNNPAQEISDVMKLFEGDMAGLQKDIASLQRYAEGKSRGSPSANSQRQKHCQHIVATLRHSAQEHTKAFRDALLLRAAVEKQQNDRQRIFSHSRGVAPATQLDYPLFGSAGGGNNGLRSRPQRRPAARPPPPSFPPPPSPSKGDKNGRPPSSAPPPPPPFGSSTFPSSSAMGAAMGDGGGAGGGGGGGGGGQDSWPQKTSLPPPWSAEGAGSNSSGNAAAGGPFGSGAGKVDRVSIHSGGGGMSGAGEGRYGGVSHKVTSPFGSGGVNGGAPGGAGAYGSGRGGGGRGGAYGSGGGAATPLPPTEAFRGGNGAFGLRKRGGREDGGDAEEDARRAAWQVQVQEESKNRVEESHKVEKMIGDLGQMFSRFSTMVAAQEEVVMHIEDDVEAAHTFAEEGQAHLAKYYEVMSGNRGIIVKMFIMLIVFIWLFLSVMP